MDDRLYLQIPNDDTEFLEDLKAYFKDDLSIAEIRNFGDPLTLLSIGISVAALTLQAIDFISLRTSKKDGKEEQSLKIPEEEQRIRRFILFPDGRVELSNYPVEDIAKLIFDAKEAKNDAKRKKSS